MTATKLVLSPQGRSNGANISTTGGWPSSDPSETGSSIRVVR